MGRVPLAWGALALLAASCGDGGSGTSAVGVGGSTSRLAIVGDHLYALKAGEPARWPHKDRAYLETLSIADPAKPTKVRTDRLDYLPETLFADGSRLFAGTTTGMAIFDLAEPEAPRQAGFVPHFTACDPVVTSGDKAFVTIRDGFSNCRFGVNELHVIDVADINSPTVLATYPMASPGGLGVYDGYAYVCDGSRGLVVMAVADPLAVREISAMADEVCFDVIVSETDVISTGVRGVAQYKRGEGGSLTLLSRIDLVTP